MYHPVPTTIRGGVPTDSGDPMVTLDQVPRWSNAEFRYAHENEGPTSSYFPDPLASASGSECNASGMVSKFPLDHEINSKIYLWRGDPWNLEVDAVVNSTNEVRALHSSICFACLSPI